MRHFFNILFTAIFICTFSFIIYTFSDSIVLAFSSEPSLLSENTELDIADCQDWTKKIRQFKVPKGDQANRIPIINYHKIIDDTYLNNDHFDEDNNLHTTIVLKSQFEKQMAFLKKHHFVTLTTAEFQKFMKNELDVPKNSIYITFDDGFKNTYYEAYPILKKYGFTATNFLITGYIHKKEEAFNPADSQYLSIGDIAKGCDVFDYQAHTYNLHNRHSNGQSILLMSSPETLTTDLAINAQQLQKTSPLFAYPYGEYNDTVMDVLQDLQINYAFTTEEGDARPGQNLLKIPRKTVLPTHTMKDFITLINM